MLASLSLNTFLNLGIMIFVGMTVGRLMKLIKLPNVTGYLIAGLLIGPGVLGLLSEEFVEGIGIISDCALGFIAFSIGNEFRISQLRKTGKTALIIGIVQALAATLVVDVGLYLLHLVFRDKLPITAVITLGAIAAATAPAATLMVIHQYGAKGKLTDILMPVVAIDDAVGLIIFAISFGIAKVIASGTYNLAAILLEPILEIVISIVIGSIVGTLLTLSEKHFKSRGKRMSVIVTSVILAVAISMMEFQIGGLTVTISSLLLCMMLGTTFCNESEFEFSNNLMERTDRWATPFVILFFVISGAELELSVFTNITIVIIGMAFIITRSIGKYLGAYFSAKAMKCDKNVIKYLGITLLPQAGVALGMCAIVATSPEMGTQGDLVRNITLFAVLVYEIVGPYLTKVALTKAGDINEEGRQSARDLHLASKKV